MYRFLDPRIGWPPLTWIPSPEISKARRKALHAYVDEVRRLLYLQHWEIQLPDEYPEDPEDAIAQIDPCDGRYLAILRFGLAFWTQTPERARGTIIHELLHLHHVRVTDMIRLGDYKSALGQLVYDHLHGELKREVEYMVDALTTIVEEHVPLPKPWPK